MKELSNFLTLSKNDYLVIIYHSVIWGIIGYILPILNGEAIFTYTSLKLALIAGLSFGIRKAIALYITNSTGKILKPESTEPTTNIATGI